MPYTTDMAHEKVDAQLLGFKINGAQTTKNGNAETFALSAPWEIAENSRMTLSYDAVVSAVSKAITEQEVPVRRIRAGMGRRITVWMKKKSQSK